MLTQAENGAVFHVLRAREEAFVNPNPRDIGNGLNSLVDASSETALFLADTLPKEDRAHG